MGKGIENIEFEDCLKKNKITKFPAAKKLVARELDSAEDDLKACVDSLCIIDKKKHKEKYRTLAIDPYTLSLEIVVERFVKLLEKRNEHGVMG